MLNIPFHALQWGKHVLYLQPFQMGDDFPGNYAMEVGRAHY